MRISHLARISLMAAITTGAMGTPNAPAGAQMTGGARWGGRLAARQDMDRSAPAVPPGKTIAYGPDAMQKLDFWPARLAPGIGPGQPGQPGQGDAPAKMPLVLFVHGGAWTRGNKDNGTGKWKEAHFPEDGYAFATIDYRLVPGVRVEDEAADVAHALRKLIDEAGPLGIDRHRIVLMGHSAGAHLVALVGTDESYLRAAGLSFADVAGVIAIDGAAYDVPEQMRSAGAFMRGRYAEAFGGDKARQSALSPTLHAAAPNAGHFLLLHVQRPDGIRQSEELAEALRRAGTAVQINGFDGTGLIGHMTINRRLGDPDYPATEVTDAWLKELFKK